MGKRLISLLLACVLVLGMVPANAFSIFATAAAAPSADYRAAYAASVTVDGNLSEAAWLTPWITVLPGPLPV